MTFICSTVTSCLFHAGTKKPFTANLMIVSSDQNSFFKTESTEGSNIAYFCWHIPYFPQERDVIFTACQLTATSLCSWNLVQRDTQIQRSELMTTLLKWLEEKKKWMKEWSLQGWLVHSYASRCTGSLALLLQLFPSPTGSSSNPPLLICSPPLLRFAFELCKLCTPQGLSAKR